MNISLIGWSHLGPLIVKNLRQPWHKLLYLSYPSCRWEFYILICFPDLSALGVERPRSQMDSLWTAKPFKASLDLPLLLYSWFHTFPSWWYDLGSKSVNTEQMSWHELWHIEFVSSVRSSYSHPDLLLIHHPLFQITPVLNTGLSLSEPLQLYKGYNAI